jgi:hypothetical protein
MDSEERGRAQTVRGGRLVDATDDVNREVAANAMLLSQGARRAIEMRQEASGIEATDAAAPAPEPAQTLINAVPVHAGYNEAIEDIRAAALALEKGAKELEPLGEVGLRHFLLAGLVARHSGRVSAETLNAGGKTDLLLQDDAAANIVVAECKRWDGPMKFLGGLDQLLGYARRRDRGLLLVEFVRSQRFSQVLDRAIAAVLEHPAVTEAEVDTNDDSVMRVVVRHPRDESQLALVTVLFVDLPVARGASIGGDTDTEGGLDAVLGLRQQLMAAGGKDVDYVVHAVGPEQDLDRPDDTLVRAVRGRADGSRVVIDAVAGSDEARRRYGVKGALALAPDQLGDHAQRILEEAVRWQVGAYIRRGVGIHFDQYPPGLENSADALQDADSLTVTLTPRADWSWPVTLHVETDRGEAHVRLEFIEVDPEEGWEHTLRASFHNMSVSFSQRRESNGSISSNYAWRFHPTDAPVRDRLAALDFHYALSGAGALVWESHIDELPSQRLTLVRQDVERSHVFDRAFFGDIVAIEDWTARRFTLPLEAPPEQVAEIGNAAAVIRSSEALMLWSGSTWRMPAPGPELGEEGEEELPVALNATVFSEDVPLGFATGPLRYRVTDISPMPERDDEVAVTLSPVDEDAKVVRVAGLWRPDVDTATNAHSDTAVGADPEPPVAE